MVKAEGRGGEWGYSVMLLDFSAIFCIIIIISVMLLSMAAEDSFLWKFKHTMLFDMLFPALTLNK